MERGIKEKRCKDCGRFNGDGIKCKVDADKRIVIFYDSRACINIIG